ncbi:MAG: PTS transporter subunit EIIB [Sarcina sp.]
MSRTANGILQAIGRKENIEVLDNCVIRLRFKLKDVTLMYEIVIKGFESKGIMKLGSNNVQVIMRTKEDRIAYRMKEIGTGKIKVDDTTIEEEVKTKSKKEGISIGGRNTDSNVEKKI